MFDIKKERMNNIEIQNSSSVKKEILALFFTGVLSLLAAFCVYHIWEFNFYNPTDYAGDITTGCFFASNFISGDWLYSSSKIAPLGYDSISSAIGFWLHAVILKVICIFVSDPVLAVNIFYFGGFFLIGVTGYAVLRKMKIDRGISVLCAVLYTQLPYHYMRNESHLWLSAYYFLPLAGLVLYYVISGQMIQKGTQRIDKGKFIFSVIVAVLLGTSDIYYSAFFAFLIVVSGLLSAIIKKNWKSLIAIFPAIVALLLALFLVLLPFITNVISGNASDQAMRSEVDLDSFGLKWIYMILPIAGHRIKFLADFRKYCDDAFLCNNENGYATLGILLSIGLIVSLLSLIDNRKKETEWYQMIRQMGVLILFSILLAIPGGLSTLIGSLLSTAIRSYNRISIFIAFFSTITFACLLQLFKDSNMGKKWLQNKMVLSGILAFLCIFGIWDMTSADFAVKTDYDNFQHIYLSNRTELEKKISSDRKLVAEVESIMPEGSEILQLPIVSDTIYSAFPNGVAGTWQHTWKTVFSKTTQWSHGDFQGGETDRWLTRIKTLPMKELIPAVAEVGFTGIYIDPLGYEEEEFEKVCSIIEKMTGSSPIISEYGEQRFYDISEYAERRNESYTEEELKDKQSFWLEHFVMSFNAKQLYYLEEETEFRDGKAIVQKGQLQYGPYVKLEPGTYYINYYGGNLNLGEYYSTADFGEESLNIELLEQEGNHVTLKLVLEEEKENVEFLLRNDSESDIVIDKIVLEN